MMMIPLRWRRRWIWSNKRYNSDKNNNYDDDGDDNKNNNLNALSGVAVTSLALNSFVSFDPNDDGNDDDDDNDDDNDNSDGTYTLLF